MNSKLKGVIAGGVVLCCLGATLAFLEFTGKPDDSSSSSSVDTSIVEEENLYPLTTLVKESISQITFSCAAALRSSPHGLLRSLTA